MSPYQRFLSAVAFGLPTYPSLRETGDVAPAEVDPAVAAGYPAPPVFSIDSLLPGIEATKSKALYGGMFVGAAFMATGIALWSLLSANDRDIRRRSREDAAYRRGASSR